MTSDSHGPGVVWLAQRAGTTPEKLLHDPARLVDALADAVKDGTDLAVRLGSQDNETRTRAEAEARAVRARFTVAGEPTPGERFASTVARGLRGAAARARARGADGRYGPSPGGPTPPESR